jgi:hypothetical protein
MSSSRLIEIGGLTGRVNSTLQQLLRVFTGYGGSDLVTWLPQVEFSYNAI